jgi:hypothetical protein
MSLKEKLLTWGVGTVVGGAVLGVFGLIGYSTYLNATTPMYSGKVNVPGVEKVEIWEERESCGKECSRPAGTEINIYFDNGSQASVRDYNANFKIDGEDETNLPPTAPEGVSLDEILKKTAQDVLPQCFQANYAKSSE